MYPGRLSFSPGAWRSSNWYANVSVYLRNTCSWFCAAQPPILPMNPLSVHTAPIA